MLTFNELRITPDGKYLIIDVSVSNESYYKDVIIDSIIIDTQNTYVATGPSNKPIYTYTLEDDGLVQVYDQNDNCPILDESESYCFVEDKNNYKRKNIRLLLSAQDLQVSLKDTMFFVYAIASGTPAADTPCGMDNSITMGTVVDLYPMYGKTIQYLKELNNECSTPKGLTDMIFRIKALELSIKTGNYTQAINYWNKYFINLQNKTDYKSLSCGCNN